MWHWTLSKANEMFNVSVVFFTEPDISSDRKLTALLVCPCSCFRGWQSASPAVAGRVKLPLQPRNKSGHVKVFFSWLAHSSCNTLGERLNKNVKDIPTPVSLSPKSPFVSTWVSPQQAWAVHSPFKSVQLDGTGRHCCDNIYPQSAGVYIQLHRRRRRRSTLPLSGL